MRASSTAPRTLAAIMALLIATTSLSCNAIVGLDDFEKVDGSVDAGVTDAGKDEFIQLPEGTLPATWARWTMADNVAGTKGFSVGGVFMPGGAGVAAVLDTNTNLVWLVETGFAKTFDEARDYCTTKTNGPWRVPSRIELTSILDFSKTDRIDPSLFPNAGREATWTASPVRPLATALQYWALNFKANVTVITKLNVTNNTTLGSVRCVKTK